MPWRTLVLAVVVAALLGAALLLSGARVRAQARLGARQGFGARLARTILKLTTTVLTACAAAAAVFTMLGSDVAAAGMLTVAAFWLVVDIDVTLLTMAGGTSGTPDEGRPVDANEHHEARRVERVSGALEAGGAAEAAA